MNNETLRRAIYNGMFSERDTVEDAFHYVDQLARGSTDSAAIWTAVGVMLNTVSRLMQQQETVDTPKV